MSESVFQAKVQKLRRVAIPKPICAALDVQEGDVVEIKLRKVQKQ